MAHPRTARLWASARRAAGARGLRLTHATACRASQRRDPRPRRRGSVRHPGRAFIWFLLARAVGGAGPAGALRAPNFASAKIVFARAKTNSMGSNLDRRRRPAERGPGMVRVQRNPPAVREPQVAVEIARQARDTIQGLDYGIHPCIPPLRGQPSAVQKWLPPIFVPLSRE